MISTREFSKNPSEALRKSLSQPVMVTKYGRPVACLVSIDSWDYVIDLLRSCEIEEQLGRDSTNLVPLGVDGESITGHPS